MTAVLGEIARLSARESGRIAAARGEGGAGDSSPDKLAALEEVVAVLDAQHLPYALVGGVAVGAPIRRAASDGRHGSRGCHDGRPFSCHPAVGHWWLRAARRVRPHDQLPPSQWRAHPDHVRHRIRSHDRTRGSRRHENWIGSRGHDGGSDRHQRTRRERSRTSAEQVASRPRRCGALARRRAGSRRRLEEGSKKAGSDSPPADARESRAACGRGLNRSSRRLPTDSARAAVRPAARRVRTRGGPVRGPGCAAGRCAGSAGGGTRTV